MVQYQETARPRRSRAGGRIAAAVALCAVTALTVGCAPTTGAAAAGGSTAGGSTAGGAGNNAPDAEAAGLQNFAGSDPVAEFAPQYPAKYDIDGRDAPTNTAHRTVDVYRAGDLVGVDCQIEGDLNGGSRIWNHTTDGYWIPDWLIKTGTDGFVDGLARCNDQDELPAKPVSQKTEPKKTKPKKTKPKKNQSKKNEPSAAEQDKLAKDHIRVVALGDSFASGEGLFNYDPRTMNPSGNTCHRSPQSWQTQVTFGDLGKPLEFNPFTGRSLPNPRIDFVHRACSGAVAKDVYKRVQQRGDSGKPQRGEKVQVDWLDGSEDYVLLSIGGNDAQFADVLTECAEHNCLNHPLLTEAESRITQTVVPEMRKAIDAIHLRAPSATIVLAGYPELIRSTGESKCRGWVLGKTWHIDPEEGKRLDALARNLREQTVRLVDDLRTAESIDIRYVDVAAEFSKDGQRHGACSGYFRQWINSVTSGGMVFPERFHPKAKGHAAYVRAVNRVIS